MKADGLLTYGKVLRCNLHWFHRVCCERTVESACSELGIAETHIHHAREQVCLQEEVARLQTECATLSKQVCPSRLLRSKLLLALIHFCMLVRWANSLDAGTPFNF